MLPNLKKNLDSRYCTEPHEHRNLEILVVAGKKQLVCHCLFLPNTVEAEINFSYLLCHLIIIPNNFVIFTQPTAKMVTYCPLTT